MLYVLLEEPRSATERQLHETVTAQAWAREHRWAQVRARQEAAAKSHAEAAAGEPAALSAPIVLPTSRLAPAVAPEVQADVVDQAPLQ